MRPMTRLEEVLSEDTEFARLKAANAPAGEVQKRLDEIATEVCRKVGDDELMWHMVIVYNETAATDAKSPEHGNVPDALLTFMNYIPDGARVLDIGCGFGRDSVFMALRDSEKRQQFMGCMKDGKTALERFGVPGRSFHVTGIDSSSTMMAHASIFAEQYGFDPGYGSRWGLPSSVCFAERMDMYHLRGDRLGRFDGIWSSSALFMHTPEALMRPAMGNVAALLKKDGVFGVTYARNTKVVPHDNLRYSRTGEIKYFSRPLPWEVITYAEAVGFVHCEEEFSDRVVGDTVQKDFFITQFFEKQKG